MHYFHTDMIKVCVLLCSVRSSNSRRHHPTILRHKSCTSQHCLFCVSCSYLRYQLLWCARKFNIISGSFLVNVSLVVRLNRVLWRNLKAYDHWRPIHLDDVYQWGRFVIISFSFSDWLILGRSQPGSSSFWLDSWVHNRSLLIYVLTLFKPS